MRSGMAAGIVAAAILAGVQLGTAPAGAAQEADPAALVKEGQKLEFAGQRADALERYRKALALNPKQFDAHLGIGRAMHLEGKYAEGRTHLQQALALAPENGINPSHSTLAVSWMFEGNTAEAAKHYQQAFDRQIKAGALESAAGTANALGRAYLETGDFANAEKWYRTGYDTAQKVQNLSPAAADLWAMRWHHAQGRIAARRKNFPEAQKHVAEVRTIVARGSLDESQRANEPHLAGYVAFYEGRYDDAIAALAKADQDDPFILALLAQAHEQKKDTARAQELYKRVMDANGFSLQLALARPLAQRRLAGR